MKKLLEGNVRVGAHGPLRGIELRHIERRPPSGIWGGLWSLPEIPDDEDVSDWCLDRLHVSPVDTDRWDTLRHSFSHFDLDIKPIAVRLDAAAGKVADSETSLWYKPDADRQIGLAAPVAKLIQSLTLR